MKLDKKLNLVIPLDYGKVTVYVHATPISREVFENSYMVLAKTFSKIHTSGIGVIAGPRVAAMTLKEVAIGMGQWDGVDGIANTLMAEIVRRANVIMPKESGGWQTIPFQEALDQKLLDEDDASEVVNALAFFTVASSMYPRRDLSAAMKIASNLWGGQCVPSTCTDFAASLPTSTETDSTGEKKPADSLIAS